VIDKLMDVMAEFGLKKDEEAKKANRPKEHAAKEGSGAAASGEPDAHAAG
jgi:hypothetical protein